MRAKMRASSLLSVLKLHSTASSPRCISTGVRSFQRAQTDSEGFYSPEHKEIQNSLKKIIDNDINPYVDEWEKDKMFPAHEVFKKLGQAGFLGINKPTEYGGLGLDYSYVCAFHEQLGDINCGGIPMAICVQTDICTPALSRFGSDYLKKTFLAPSISGDLVGCLGVSEASAGSDVANIKTNAVKKGDDYIINGSKMWTTNGIQADWICLLCNTSQGKPHQNKSLICVPMDAPGVQKARKIEKIGMHCSDTAELYFEDVRVPQSHVIGDEGSGFLYQMLQFQEERMSGAALTLRPLDKCIETTIEYTRQRRVYNQPLINNQVIHFRLAELQTEIEALRSLLYRAIGIHMDGNDATLMASMAKLKAGRLAREVTDSCLQYWGGMGFTDEVLVSRFYRDMRLLSIGAGADEVMLGIICKYMGILPSLKKK